MKAFEAGGHAWEVRINVASAKRVKDLIGVDLLAVLSEDGKRVIERLVNDPASLVDVLWVLCEKQAEARGMDGEAFGTMFSGEAIETATQALIAELIDFFPPSRRAPLAAAVAKINAITEAGTKLALDRINEMDPEALLQNALQARTSKP